jgi:C_GCAxxG_C_C family probable redox protein
MKKFHVAKTSDYPALRILLKQCRLPESDIGKGNQHFLLVKNMQDPIASACIEVYGKLAIFRSFAVQENYRKQGLGNEMYTYSMEQARNLGIESIYLLTTTAEGYFFKRGWIRVNRTNVPREIQRSAEFAEICPSSAICMFLALKPGVIKEAIATYLSDFNCSQAVLSAFAPSLGIEKKYALKLTTGFGGGIAGSGELCGAVSGAYMAIGLKYGRSEPEDLNAKLKTLNFIAEFNKLFTERNGSLRCKDLLKADMSKSEGRQKLVDNNAFEKVCPTFIKDATEIVEYIFNE